MEALNQVFALAAEANVSNSAEEVHLEMLNRILDFITEAGIVLFEFMGVFVLVVTGIVGIYNYVRKNTYTRLNLAKGMAMGLEFKLGSEILRTVVVREWTEIFLVAGIILLRAALTLLIHWEIKNEKKEFDELNIMKEDSRNKKDSSR